MSGLLIFHPSFNKMCCPFRHILNQSSLKCFPCLSMHLTILLPLCLSLIQVIYIFTLCWISLRKTQHPRIKLLFLVQRAGASSQWLITISYVRISKLTSTCTFHKQHRYQVSITNVNLFLTPCVLQLFGSNTFVFLFR